MRRIAPIVVLVIAVAVAVALYQQSAANKVSQRTILVMGTAVTMRAHGKNAEAAFDAIASRFQQIHELMTINEPGSETLRIKEQAGVAPVPVGDDTFHVLSTALRFSEATAGKFDVSVEPVVSLWRIGFPDARVPSKAEIDARKPLVGYERIRLDPEKKTVYLPEKGMGVDLGGIAKGYAADVAESIFRQHKVKSALISVGGNVYAVGKKPDGSRWRIGIQDPEDTRGSYVATLDVEDQTLVTSGGYERFLEVDGKKYHHIIDPDTGYPAETDLVSVTIVTKRSIEADALSTSLFIMGRQKAMQFARSLPGVDVVLIDKNHSVYATSGIADRLIIGDDNYRLVR